MAKIYDTEGKILTGDNFPQLKIGGKLFVIDNRKSTFDKIQKMLDEQNKNPKEGVSYEEEVVKLALANKEQFNDIKTLVTSVKAWSELSIYIMAAIQEEEYEVIKEALSKN